MSRGPGVWQRTILDRIAEGKILILTSADHTHAEQNAIRRAARTLEAAGKIQITSYRIDSSNRLVAASVGTQIAEPRKVTGLDGKTYLLPQANER